MNQKNITQEYINAVTDLADAKTNRRFLNDSIEHAKLLANLMIGRVKQDTETCIYRGTLGKDCFAMALENSQVNIRILLDSADGKNVIEQMNQQVKDRAEIRLANRKYKSHFFISWNSFQYEIDHEQTCAIANFNEPETVIKLKNLFNELWEDADAI